ncbi:ANTAR domain-containing protein [uncultured Jatrophihabitans sp.]|uniref:ANTAR domain-containing protein n=1 Tax=uncultured Jatrophihabitans sp. TaxID=1610747 RepID=UPI0035C96087
MAAEDLFRHELSGAPDPQDDPYRVGRIAAAAARALGAAGASISVQVSEVRVPFGASDATAALAESVQFTEGVGPCIESIMTRSRVDAPASVLRRRWPGLAERWRTDTPYRSALSEPILLDGVTGALDVYLTHDDGAAGLGTHAVDTVSALVTTCLREDFYASIANPDVERRSVVWVAIGMTRERFGIDASEALSRVRDQAREAGVTVDDFARQLLIDARRLH